MADDTETLEGRWQAFASETLDGIGEREFAALRGAFYAGACSAWRLTMNGHLTRLHRDISAFIAVETMKIEIEEAADRHGR